MAGFDIVLREMQASGCTSSLVLSVNNEPFLHPKLTDFCLRASEALPDCPVELISNGALITKEHLKALAMISIPPKLVVDDYTPDHRIIGRIEDWARCLPKPGLDIRFQRRSWNEMISNRAGNQPGCSTDANDYRDITCTWPFGMIFLNPELEAFLCCSDYQYACKVGDLKQQSLMDIWRGPALTQIREHLLVPDRAAVPLCKQCDAEWWVLPHHMR